MIPQPPEKTIKAKPFLKWAGGKSQLIPQIEAALPKNFGKKELIYVEPFAGSGAAMFWMLKKFPNISTAVINDVNADLCNAFLAIKNSPRQLIDCLWAIEKEYYALKTEEGRRGYFLQKREAFNSRLLITTEHTALLIFLNRTCFNGLYRVNSKNRFNVPFGKYANPKICDEETILADSAILQRVTILNGDYANTLAYAGPDAFFYFDPPYKPISKTASFNAYANGAFNDAEQVRLKAFCDTLTQKNCAWLLSNSDPKNINPTDNFFDELYSGAGITINRVLAKRSINSNSAKRGEIKELLICNY